MKKLLQFTQWLLALLVTLPTLASAHDFEAKNADGVTIYYNITPSDEVAVTYRGSNSFQYDEYTGVVNIPSTVTYKGTNYSVTSIGDDAFSYSTGLTSVTIPNSVTSIGNYAFWNCTGLTSVTIPNSVTKIGGFAFSICSGLSAFYGKFASQDNRCLIVNGVLNSFAPSGLTSFSIPNSVTSIGGGAFFSCTGLTSVTIGNSVTSIGPSAFRECTGLRTVTIPNSVTSIADGAFNGCSGLTSVTIGNSVTSIGDGAFGWCTGLTSVTIGNSVTSIGSGAFEDCSGLTSVTIPNSVTSIGLYAFYGCTGLTSVKVCNPKPDNIYLDGSCIFYYVPISSCTLYVPKGSKNLYASADQWKDFGNIEEFVMPDTNNYLYCNEISVYKDNEFTVSVEMSNKAQITAFQCDIIVPEGLSIAMDDDDEYDITLGSRAHRSHDLSTALTANGEVRLVCYSMKLSPFSGNDGELFAIHFNPAIAPGNYEVKITNIELTDTSENIYSPDDITINVEVKPYPNGDANGDGTVSISDVVAVANHILGNTPNGFIEDAADANGDGKITVADIVRIAIIILNQSASSAPTKAIAKTETYDSGEMNIRSFEIAGGLSEVAEVVLDTPDYDVTALQFDITLPKGLTIKTDNSEYAFGLTDRATNDHLVQSDKLDDGSIRVICYSSNSINLSGREGAVITFPAIATNDFNGGDIEITGIEVVENDGTKHALAPVAVKVSETSGVELVGSDNAEAVYYSLQGVPVANPTKGIYVKVQNGKAERVLVK